MIKKILFAFILMLVSAITFAQASGSVEMADNMRQNGKIYVVVAVILTIFTGIIIYLVRLDRKITKLEKEYSNQ